MALKATLYHQGSGSGLATRAIHMTDELYDGGHVEEVIHTMVELAIAAASNK